MKVVNTSNGREQAKNAAFIAFRRNVLIKHGL